jgi:hypothetical protein
LDGRLKEVIDGHGTQGKSNIDQHIDEEFERLKTRGEPKTGKIHDWTYFFKMI